ncbi:MAG: hypothetical protein Q8L81_07975 [Bacteroidota bacterium]|nr:hypothetical protein [Bacteroidota bacterium]
MKNLIIGKRDALSNWLRQFVTIIDIEKRMYKLQEGFLGIFKWGTYKPLPKIDYVLVFRSLFAKCEACSIEENATNPNAYFQVSLVYNNTRRIIVQETKNRDEAFMLAHEVASALKTKLRDSATTFGKSTWLL